MTLIKWFLRLAFMGGLYHLGCTQSVPSADAPLVSGGRIHGKQAQALIKQGAFLLDVRTPSEFASGHIEGAINIPVQALAQRFTELPQDKAIIVYCRSGRRSASATQMIHEAKFASVYDLGPMSAYPKP